MTSRRSLIFLLFTIVLTTFGLAQTQITTGVIQGTVVDQTGALMSGADVVARNLDTQTDSAQKSDNDGRFVFLSLPPGRYTVTVSKAGFAKLVQKDLELTVGQALTLKVAMKVAGANEVVEVTGSAPVVDSTQTESASTLNGTSAS